MGLGNPGSKYVGTRHNVGFELLDRLLAQYGGSAPKLNFGGKIANVDVEQTKLLLVWPQTYMNLSGRCVSAVVNFYKIDFSTDLLIACDDLSLPLGKIRIRPKGSAGGQKGLADILRALGSQDVPRMRIGIDPAPPNRDSADYVLSRFSKDDRQVIDQTLDQAGLAVEAWCGHDLQYCMNHFNK